MAPVMAATANPGLAMCRQVLDVGPETKGCIDVGIGALRSPFLRNAECVGMEIGVVCWMTTVSADGANARVDGHENVVTKSKQSAMCRLIISEINKEIGGSVQKCATGGLGV